MEEPPEEAPLATGTIVVRFVDENQAAIGETVTRELSLGTHNVEAKNFVGYELISDAIQSVSLTQEREVKEVIFIYRLQEPEPVPDTPPTDDSVTEEETIPDVVQPAPQLPVVGISLVAEPYKTTYLLGEELELDGLIVFRVLSDGSEQEIPLADLNVKGFNSEEPADEQVITVEYAGFTAQFTVTIEDEKPEGFFSRLFKNPLFNFKLFLILLVALPLIAFLLIKRRKEKSGHKPAVKKPLSNKARKKRVLLIILGILVSALLVFYGGAMYFLAQLEREGIAQSDESLGISVTGVRGIASIAILGIDSEDGLSGRSDAIMILTVDRINDKIKITSIPRDAYVNIPGRGMDKINHAHAFGGPELTLITINQNFNLDIRHFISVNFTSMPAIIDAVGGVPLEITDREAREIWGINSGGTHILNGNQALSFSRIRNIDSDFERARRQRDVMESIIKSALRVPVTSYPEVVNNVFPHLKTNLTSNQMLNLGTKTVLNNINTIQQAQFPPRSLGKGQIINSVYYYVFDREIGARMLYQYIYHDVPME